MIFITFFFIAWGFIRYDENTFRSFHIVNKGFYCFNNIGRTQEIKFRDSFENIPQVILIPELFDVPGNMVNYKLEIIEITQTKFILNIKCLEGVIYGIHYKWLAIDDARIQVINKFNINNFEELTLDHPNSNAQNYLISVIAFSYIGNVNFQVQVSEITAQNLKIKITDPQNTLTNLISLSYQIILGIDETFSQQEVLIVNSAFTSNQFPSILSSWLLLPFIGFEYDGVNDMKFKKLYYLSGINNYYSFYPGNFLTNTTGCCCIPTFYHGKIWMKFQHTVEAKPLEIGSTSIIYYKDSKVDYIQSFKVQIEGNPQKATSLGNTRIVINKGEQNIILNSYVKCYGKETLNIIQNGITDPIIHQCLDSFQEIMISVTLISTSVVYKDLIVDIQESQCSISQLLFNQKFSQVSILSIHKQ